MAAGQKCCAVGVVRLVLGDIFAAKEVVLEAHHGIEDQEENVEYTRVDDHRLSWEKAKSLVKAEDWDAVLRFVAACEKELLAGSASAKGKRLEAFDEAKIGRAAVPFSPP